MSNPHVVSLKYALDLDNTLRFDNPAPVEGDAGRFTYRLDNGVLMLTMKVHFATTREARDAVEPFLRAWEVTYALERGRREFRFDFVQPQIIDQSGGHVLPADTVKFTLTGHDAALIVPLRIYPTPPVDFEAFFPDVETLWNRYENQLLGREYLPSMGYFCLTVIETLYGVASAPKQPRKASTKRAATAPRRSVEAFLS